LTIVAATSDPLAASVEFSAVAAQVGQPVFLFGITQRTGTHYLYDALLLHPQVIPAVSTPDPWRPSWEDHLVSEADTLLSYVDRVSSRWNLDDAQRARVADRLLASLGAGIGGFLRDLVAERLAPGGDLAGRALPAGEPGGGKLRPLTKTPTVANLELVDQLFPGSAVVVIVRDPRAVVASSLASFGGNGERWIRHWKRMAGILLDFDRAHPGRVSVVRYEQLFGDPVAAVKGVLEEIGLETDGYDFDALVDLPIRGSSEVPAPGRGGWTPVARPPGFDPLDRGRNLSPTLLSRLDWLTAPEQALLGYGGPAHTVSSPARQRLLDARWRVARGAYRSIDHLYAAAMGAGRSG
jgi:hypothetical protein